VRRLSVWLVLGSLTISASPTTTTPSRPTRGKAGSGATETVRGRLSVNQRSSPHVAGRCSRTLFAPSYLRVVVWVAGSIGGVNAALFRQDGAGGVVSPNSSVI
jgi:hypothetical protein